MAKKTAFVDQSRCVACGVCVKACPRDAIAVWKGCYAKVDAERCVGCGKCAKACPAGCAELREREAAV